MVEALLYNKWFWIGMLGLIALIVYKRFFSKSKPMQLLEQEYHEIINSEKYKVKGQHD